MSVNGKKIYEFKAKYSEIKPYPLSFGNPSKKFYRWQHEKTGLSAYVYSFSVDYYILDVSDIVDIHIYLMKQQSITNCLH